MELALLDDRSKIRELEKVVETMPQLEIELKHHFIPGIYAREGFIPKGTVFVGRVHHQPQINIVSKGDITVLTESGLVRMTAPFTMTNPPGAQRCAYAHEDTVWTTILATDDTDPDNIFNTLTSATFEDFQLACDELMRLKGD